MEPLQLILSRALHHSSTAFLLFFVSDKLQLVEDLGHVFLQRPQVEHPIRAAGHQKTLQVRGTGCVPVVL